MSTIEGGCACGAIRFEIEGPLMGSGACHCRACQYASGGAPAYLGIAPTAGFKVTKGTPKRYVSTGDSGGDVVRNFCPDCGTSLFTELTNSSITPVKLGALDDPSSYAPGMHFYVSEAQPWHHITPGVPTFPKAPG